MRAALAAVDAYLVASAGDELSALRSNLAHVRDSLVCEPPDPSDAAVARYWTAFSGAAGSARKRKAFVRSGTADEPNESGVASRPIGGSRFKVWCALIGAKSGEAARLHYEQVILQIFDGIGPDDMAHDTTVELLPWYVPGVSVETERPIMHPASANATAHASVKRMLCALQSVEPDVEHAPGLATLALAALRVADGRESDAFSMLRAALRRAADGGDCAALALTVRGEATHCALFDQAVRQFCGAPLAAHLNSLGMAREDVRKSAASVMSPTKPAAWEDEEDFVWLDSAGADDADNGKPSTFSHRLYATWFRHFFQPYLTPRAAERLIDCVLSEGRKVLFRFGVALLSSCRVELMLCTTTERVHALLRSLFASGATSVESLLQRGFQLKMSRAKHLVEAALPAELRLTAEKERARWGAARAVDPALLCRRVVGTVETMDGGVKEIVSSLLTPRARCAVLPLLPPVLQYSRTRLLYTTEHHGVGLVNLLQHAGRGAKGGASEPTLLLIKVLGTPQVLCAFVGDAWTSDALGRGHERHGTFPFIARLHRTHGASFQWRARDGSPSAGHSGGGGGGGAKQRHIAFAVSEHVGISIGVDGDSNSALWLSTNLRSGRCERSTSFGGAALLHHSEVLDSDGDGVCVSFEIEAIEVIGFEADV